MAHIDHDSTSKSKITMPLQWYTVAQQVAELANDVSKRINIQAKVAEETSAGPHIPACFWLHTAELELSLKATGLIHKNPLSVDLKTEEGRLGCLSAVGAVLHEAAHARHTNFRRVPPNDPRITQRIFDVMNMLEESRIEARLLNETSIVAGSNSHGMTRSDMKLYLKSMALDIVMRDFKIAETPYGASMGAGLVLARVTSGVFDPIDVEYVRVGLEKFLSPSILKGLEDIWTEYQSIDTANADVWQAPVRVEQMIALAKRWLDVLSVDYNDPTPDLSSTPMPMPGEGEEGEGEGEGDGEDGDEEGQEGKGQGKGKDGDGDLDGEGDGRLKAGEKNLRDMIREAATDIAMDADDQATDRRMAQRSERFMKERKVAQKRGSEAQKVSDEIFPPNHGYGGDAINSHLRRKRDPKPEERIAAVQLARELEKVQYQDRAVSKKTTVVPPGRLRPRGAVQRAQQKSRGAILTAEPWQQHKRTHTDETPLTVGLMMDISGSMSSAGASMGLLGWMLPEAMHRVDGQVASVLYGSRAYGVLKPGEHGKEVLEWSARDGMEAFKPAFQAIDGALNLLNGEGARLLVIASDGHYGHHDHDQFCTEMMTACRSKGVAVIWLNFTHGVDNHGYGEIVPVYGLTAVEVAKKVGVAAVAALKYSSGGRA